MIYDTISYVTGCLSVIYDIIRYRLFVCDIRYHTLQAFVYEIRYHKLQAVFVYEIRYHPLQAVCL